MYQEKKQAVQNILEVLAEYPSTRRVLAELMLGFARRVLGFARRVLGLLGECSDAPEHEHSPSARRVLGLLAEYSHHSPSTRTPGKKKFDQGGRDKECEAQESGEILPLLPACVHVFGVFLVCFCPWGAIPYCFVMALRR